MIWLIIGFIVVGLGILIGGVIVSQRSSSLIEERLGITEEAAVSADEVPRKSPMADALNRAMTSRGLGSNMATQLARADLKITVAEFMAVTVLLVVVAGAVVFFLRRGDILATAGACLLAFFAPRTYVGMLRGRRLKAFNNQLSDSINLLVNSLRAGYSVMQAMEAIAEEMGPPISVEFGRVVQEVQFGITLEQALAHMLRRITSEDLDMLVTAINVQREVGGNLAEVLDSISHTIRERVRIKGDMQSLTAQSRISGYMVSVIPVALAGFMYLINPEFISLLFTHICGYIMLGAAFLGIILGFVIMNKMMQIDV
ncbi:MAG: type II secretion system F family protein [Chloroflexota bacterium]|nr:type II secretion system F family protein [Chloroflexota bacterium]